MPKKIIAAGGLVINDNNELLMIFRRGFWDLPKGKLDKGESIEDCALREVQEETGVSPLELGKLLGITYHDYYDKYLKKNVTKETHWYLMHTKGKPKLIPQTEEDITEIIWADNKKVKECLKNSYKNIEEIVEKMF